MKISERDARTSSIAAWDEEKIVVRGRDLCADLIGQSSFADHIWLLLTGNLPNSAQRAMLDASLVAMSEHGMIPSIQASRMTLYAAPEALQGAVAAGILGCGSVFLGSSEAAGRFFDVILSRAASCTLEGAAHEVITEYRKAHKAIPGYGHPLHKGPDPRSAKLLEVAKQVGVYGNYCKTAEIVDRLLPQITKKQLPMNVSSVVPAVLLDAGFPLQALKSVPILARTASLVAHLLEEIERPIGFTLSHAAAKAISYDGAAAPGLRYSAS